MKSTNLYSNAHLVVAAIRVLEHRNGSPPALQDVCQTLSFSLEQGNHICKKLNELEIIETVKGPYGTRIFIRNHLAIEKIPVDEKTTDLETAIQQFQTTKKQHARKIETFRAEQAEKQKTLFAELEKKLKDGLEKR